jgi:hypothetical protein
VPLLNVGEVAFSEAMDNANLRVESWILQMPQWKKDLVDTDGTVDMILYHAVSRYTLKLLDRS